MSLYDSLREHGPKYLVGHVLHAGDALMEVVSVLAIGNAMIVYDLDSNTLTPLVLKVPRATPGSQEHDRVVRNYRFAIETTDRARGRLAETTEIEIEGVPCFLQEKVTPLA